MSAPRVAVVVPTLEQAAFLPRALPSALAQTPFDGEDAADVEVVVVDDGSQDGGATASALAPFLAGAVAGAELKRRETRALGDAIREDLRRHLPRGR